MAGRALLLGRVVRRMRMGDGASGPHAPQWHGAGQGRITIGPGRPHGRRRSLKADRPPHAGATRMPPVHNPNCGTPPAALPPDPSPPTAAGTMRLTTTRPPSPMTQPSLPWTSPTSQQSGPPGPAGYGRRVESGHAQAHTCCTHLPCVRATVHATHARMRMPCRAPESLLRWVLRFQKTLKP
jgi:hypothetical protein